VEMSDGAGEVEDASMTARSHSSSFWNMEMSVGWVLNWWLRGLVGVQTEGSVAELTMVCCAA
jgi:hypothetical protein